jgi:hypothetical protein
MRRLGTIAVLMLLAGLSLGVFATRAVSILGYEPPTSAVPAFGTIENRAQFYRVRYHLDDARTEQVRQALVSYERAVDAKLFELRKMHPKAFDELRAETDKRIQEVLDSARKD